MGSALDIEHLTQIAPRGNEEWLRALADEVTNWEINTALRQAMFIGQYAVETNGFTTFVENLSYSVSAMLRVWPNHFPTPDSARPYSQQPEKLANFVYADINRSASSALGNIQAGDGWLFRGRGLPQLTGRSAYRACGLAINQPLEEFPELLLRPEIGTRAGCWYWYAHACNELSDRDDFEGVTRAINGGLTDLDQRKAWFGKALAILQQST